MARTYAIRSGQVIPIIYLNIHQGNSNNILSNGQPTIYFRPLLCANINASQR